MFIGTSSRFLGDPTSFERGRLRVTLRVRRVVAVGGWDRIEPRDPGVNQTSHRALGHGAMAELPVPAEGTGKDDWLERIVEELPWPALKRVADHYERKWRQERCPTERQIQEGNVRPGDYVCWQDEGYFCFPAKVFAVHRESNERGEGHYVYHVVALVQCPRPKEQETVGTWSSSVCCPANGVPQTATATFMACHSSDSFQDMEPADIKQMLDDAMQSMFATDYCE